MLFLFAVTSLSDTIQQAVGDDAQRWITRFTSHVFSAILTGIVVTTLLDSSSAVIILTIILVNSNVLSFRQAMGIVLGANIGTTIRRIPCWPPSEAIGKPSKRGFFI